MPRANRYYIPGYVWHTPVKSASHFTGQATHRCHKKGIPFEIRKGPAAMALVAFEAKKRFGLSILNYAMTSNFHLLLKTPDANLSKGMQ
ncbi:MAG: hypothetical protein R6W75_08730 [Smithellaceae bacterium]